ncbi:molybdopterin-dependent oxidoreductase [Calderihabitans maritimus]|nr:molybdopterin-dependent oxidoreductase [Calderihabitans maritimus]
METKRIRTVCRSCHGGCGVIAHVRNGRVVKVEGDADSPIGGGTMCSKGLAITRLAYHPDRILYPMKKGSRGWERVSWEEALDTIAGKFKKIIEEDGPESIFLGYGTGRDYETFLYRFANLLGTPNVLTAGHMCYGSRTAATIITCGNLPVADYRGGPRCIVLWAVNPLWTNPDEYKGADFWKAYRSGAKLIVIDPRRNFYTKKADLWLQIRPGTDAALAMGFFYVIIEEELYDREFVENYIHGWDAFVERVKEYPLDKVEEITWVDRNLIRQAARMYATTKPACIHWGVPTEQNRNCTDYTRITTGLMAATGNLDAPGGSVFFVPPPVRTASEVGNHRALPLEQVKKRLGGEQYRLASRIAVVTPRAAWDAILTGKPYPLRAGMFVGSNPLITRANGKQIYEALKKLEFLVVVDFFLTPTAELAHVFLPAATWLEQDNVAENWKRHGYVHGLLSLLDPQQLFSGEQKTKAITTLSRALTPIADEIASAFPGVGVGYYALCVDSIVAYAPSSQFGDKVGISVWPDHIGRRAMREKREIVGVGSTVRGDIMNCVRPLIRDGRVIGFVWANETVEDIYRQLQQGERNLFFSGGRLEVLLGLTWLLVLSARQLGHIKRFSGQGSAEKSPGASRSLIEAFLDMQRYLEMFLNTVNSGLVVLSRQGQIIFLNKGAQKFFQELGINVREPVWEVFSRIGLPGLQVQIDRMWERGIGHLPLRFKVPGVPRKVDLHVIHLENNDDPCFLMVMENLEWEQEDYQWRAAKLAAAGEVAVDIAHEIRNPLAIIRGSVRLLPDRLNDREFLLRLVDVLQQEIDHINSTLEALLAFTRVAEPCFETVNLPDLLAGAVRLIEPYASDHGVRVVLNNSSRDILIQGDARYLKQAFLNLMLNAVQAMPDGGTMMVSCLRRPGSNLAEVVVRDTGVGIPASDQPKVFDVFFTRRPGGVGVGLALVQRIIDEHQGFIRLESEVGKGTAFTITLPVKRYSFERSTGGDELWREGRPF